MFKGSKDYKLHAVLGWPIAALIIIFTAGLLLWTYVESIEALNKENQISLEQRRTAIKFVLTSNITIIDQALKEARDSYSLLDKIAQNDLTAIQKSLIQLSETVENPSLDILFIQLWDGTVLSSASSPFFDLTGKLVPLGQLITPDMDNGGLVQLEELSLLLCYEPLLDDLTGQVVGRIVGASVLNDNLAILDTIHELTSSKIVALISNGKAISSTAPQSSDVVKRLAAGVVSDRTNVGPYLDPNFENNMIAGFIPVSFAGHESSLVVATAVANDTYTVIRNSYRFHLVGLVIFSLFVAAFTILLVRMTTRASLQNILTYSRKASTEEGGHPYQHGFVQEFNTIGTAMEKMVRMIVTRSRRLARTTNQLELAMRGARFGLWDWEIKTGKTNYGAMWGEILGFDLEKIPEEHAFWENRIHPDDKNGLFAAKYRCMRGESDSFSKDHRIRAKSGDWIWVSARGAVTERESNGTPKRMTGTIVDITKRKQAEDQLRESERRHRAIFENSPLGMVHFSKDGTIADCNERFVDLMGSTREKLLGFNSLERSASGMKEALATALRGSPSLFEDLYTSVTGGKTTFLRVIFSPIELTESPTDVIATYEDITRRKNAEKELKRTRKLLEDAQRLGKIGAWEYDTESNTSIWTDNLYTMFGYRPGEVDDPHAFFMGNILHPKDHGRMSELFKSAFGLSKPVSARFWAIHKSGEERYFEGVIAPQQEAGGKSERVYGVIQDITSLKVAEDKVLQAKDQAERESKSKSAFLTNMSHEIRTPLNGILGMLQLMDASGLNSEQEEYIETAILSTNRLASLLGDIFDLSKVESGKLTIKTAPFDLHKAVEDVGNLYAISAKQSGVDFSYEITESTPQFVSGDELRVQQLLTNIVGNAFKLTDSGKVTVEVSPIHEPDVEHCTVLFTVSDTGIGIPEEKMTTLFNSSSQKGEGEPEDFQSAGFGLEISKNLVLLMGGSLSVDSEEGRGTTLCFSVPFLTVHEVPSVEEADNRDETMPRLRFLLAEDDRVSRLAIQRRLEKSGHKVTHVLNGQEAIKTLRTNDFDVVLMDIQMPLMDGVEATTAVRNGEAGDDKKRIPIIALTAYAMVGDRERFLGAGVDGYIAKPVDLDELLSVVKDVL